MKTFITLFILIGSLQVYAAAKTKTTASGKAKTASIEVAKKTAKAELNTLCSLAKASLKKYGVTTKGYQALITALQPHNFTSIPVIEGWSAFRSAAPEQRYKFLKAAGKKAGVQFHCPALYKWSDFKG